jgi:hypothetical protein
MPPFEYSAKNASRSAIDAAMGGLCSTGSRKNVMTRVSQVALLIIGTSALLGGCKTSACPDTALPDGGTETHPNCVQVQPTIEYDDMTARVSSAAWASGVPITITNQLGDVFISADSTSPTQVQVSAVGFTRDTQDDTGKANATNVLKNMANPTVTGDTTSVVVNAAGGGVSGFKLTVKIPAAFDGAITVSENTGTVTFHGASAAKTTTIHTSVGDITADNLVGTINLSSGNGDLTVSATPAGTGNVLETDLGDINATIGGANLKVSATPSGGSVTFPMGWGMATQSADMMTSTVTVGDGSVTLDATTKLGSIYFQ